MSHVDVTGRLATMGALVVGGLLLVRLLAPSRRELACAGLTALIVAGVDWIAELSLGRLGVWRYRLPLSVMGVPVDLFIDFALVVFALCVGYAAAGRRANARRWKVLYVVAAGIALGTWASYKNARAAAEGVIVFAPSIGTNTPWFVVGNYLALLVVSASTAAVYELSLARWSHHDHVT